MSSRVTGARPRSRWVFLEVKDKIPIYSSREGTVILILHEQSSKFGVNGLQDTTNPLFPSAEKWLSACQVHK